MSLASGERYVWRRRNGIGQIWRPWKPHLHIESTKLHAVFEFEPVSLILGLKSVVMAGGTHVAMIRTDNQAVLATEATPRILG